jgi:ABC-2 type transport system ATP-binding protein
MRMLEVRGMEKAYGDVVALSGVDLDIAPGEVLGLLGPNGAGKSTLISIVAGLTAPDRGTVRVCGLDVWSNRLQVRRLLGIAPQELGVYLQLSVSQNLRFFGKLAGLTRADLNDRIATVSEALGLGDLLDRRAQELSGGEKRRLHTGAALLHGARLLLLDEPTAGVDIATRNSILALVKRLAADGTAICYATHYLPEVEALDASIAILEDGQFTTKGTVGDLIATFDEAVVEIRFDTSLPTDLAVEGRVDGDECLVRLRTRDPGVTISRVLTSVGHFSNQVATVEIVQPSLESAFLAITGHRFDANAPRQVV